MKVTVATVDTWAVVWANAVVEIDMLLVDGVILDVFIDASTGVVSAVGVEMLPGVNVNVMTADVEFTMLI